MYKYRKLFPAVAVISTWAAMCLGAGGCVMFCGHLASPAEERAQARGVVETLESSWLKVAHGCVNEAADDDAIEKCKSILISGRDAIVAAIAQVDSWEATPAQAHGFACLITIADKSIRQGLPLAGDMSGYPVVTDGLELARPYVAVCSKK